MLQPASYHQLDQLASDACLSVRQFERKFRERLGVSPKLFSRIARFRHAYKLRETDPVRSWIDIAYACSYYDPNHLVKDFQQFAGTNPSQLFDEELAHQRFLRPVSVLLIRLPKLSFFYYAVRLRFAQFCSYIKQCRKI